MNETASHNRGIFCKCPLCNEYKEFLKEDPKVTVKCFARKPLL